MRLRLTLLSFVLFLVNVLSADERQVGELSNPQNWRITGLRVLPEEEVRRALTRDLPVLLALHPRATIGEAPAVIEQRLLVGLHRAGFRNAKVTVTIHTTGSQEVEIAIHEGHRFRTGKVLVTGIQGAEAEQIVTALTKVTRDLRTASPEFDSQGNVVRWLGPNGKEPEKQKVLWEANKPVPFDPLSLNAFHDRIRQCLENCGYGASKVDVSIKPSGDVADLCVHVSDLGPQMVLQAIEIDGNERDTDQEISEYLGVRIGDPLSSARRLEFTRILWNSGRFADHKVLFKSTGTGTTLQIQVVDTQGAPRLVEPLPRHTEALLKCREWLTAGGGKNHDIVIENRAGEHPWQVILSREGILATLHHPDGDRQSISYALFLGNEGAAWCEVQDQRKVAWGGSSKFNLESQIYLKANTAKSADPLLTTFGAGVTSVAKGSAFILETSLAPSYFVAWGALPANEPKWDENILTLTGAKSTTRLNADTGELLSIEFRDDGQSPCGQIYAERNRLRTAKEQLLALTKGHANHFDPTMSISSLTLFLSESKFPDQVADRFNLSADARKRLSAVQSLLTSVADRRLLEPIDRQIFKWMSSPEKSPVFEIPMEPPQEGNIVHMVAKFVAGYSDLLFARETWPWTVWREASFVATGRTMYTSAELDQLMQSGKCGPVGHWVLVELLSRVNGDAAVAVASHGLGTINRFSFRSDCEQLLSQHWEHVIPIVQWLGNLKNDELASLAMLFSIEPEVLIGISESLRHAPPEEAQDEFLDALVRMWTKQWHSQIESRFREVISAREKAGSTAADPANKRR